MTVPAPATPAGVCAAVLAARPDLGKLLDAKGQYAGFELSLVDPKTGRPMDPGVDDAIPNDAKMELVLSKGYAVRALLLQRLEQLMQSDVLCEANKRHFGSGVRRTGTNKELVELTEWYEAHIGPLPGRGEEEGEEEGDDANLALHGDED